MNYHLKYDNFEKNTRLYIIKIIYNKINNNNFTINSTNILCKILNKTLNENFFKNNIIFELLKYTNSLFIYNNIIINIKKKFIKSLLLTIFHNNFGIYLLKHYYIQFYIIYSYQQAIKFICNKIYQKSKYTKNRNLSNRYNKNLLYHNITNINNILVNIDRKYKFSYNDDNNYNIVNDVILLYVHEIKKDSLVKNSKFYLEQNEKNIFLKMFKNINNISDNIY